MEVKNKELLVIMNYAPHYRYPIYSLLEDQYNVQWIFGDHLPLRSIKKLNLSSFSRSHLHNTIRLWKLYYLPGTLYALFKHKVVIVTGEPYFLNSWVALIVGKVLNKKIILWSHGYYGSEGFFKILLKRIYFSLSVHSLLYWQHGRDGLINIGISQSKLTTIFNSLHFERELNKKLDYTPSFYVDLFGNTNPVLVFLGRVTKVKKIDQLLAAISLLKQKVNVVIIGPIIESIEPHNILNYDSIYFTGEIYEDKILSNYLANASLCISPGNVGLTAMHSLRYGLPVITHGDFSNQMPEVEIIEPGVNGDLFRINDVTDLASTIDKWLDKSHKVRNKDVFRDRLRKNYTAESQLRLIRNVVDDLYV